MHVLLLICLALTGAGFVGGLLVAPPASERPDQTYLALGAGHYDALDNGDIAQDVDLRGELRFAQRWGSAGLARVHPFAGLEASADARYALGGVLADIRYERWYLAPSLGAGLYEARHRADLGATLEFRSQFEFGHVFSDGQRLALALSHLSNAGLGDENPGVEVLTLYWQWPWR